MLHHPGFHRRPFEDQLFRLLLVLVGTLGMSGAGWARWRMEPVELVTLDNIPDRCGGYFLLPRIPHTASRAGGDGSLVSDATSTAPWHPGRDSSGELGTHAAVVRTSLPQPGQSLPLVEADTSPLTPEQDHLLQEQMERLVGDIRSRCAAEHRGRWARMRWVEVDLQPPRVVLKIRNDQRDFEPEACVQSAVEANPLPGWLDGPVRLNLQRPGDGEVLLKARKERNLPH